jgi:pyruvate,water dikinase
MPDTSESDIVAHAIRFTIPFAELSAADVDRVGAKNASLGEMTRALRRSGIAVPPGFALTVEAFGVFLRDTGLDVLLGSCLARLDAEEMTLAEASGTIRKAILSADMPRALRSEIVGAYRALGGADVAVRSSATNEDLPNASFAGQLDTFLNVQGEDDVVDACRRCYASLFTERVMAYRRAHGFSQTGGGLSIGIQRMVRADLGAAGVMFTLDTESGFRDVVRIDGAWGLGESVVQGSVDPDEYVVFKPLLGRAKNRPILEKRIGSKKRKMVYRKTGATMTRSMPTSKAERERFVLTDDEILQLAAWGCAIESHFGRAMDIEWAKDGKSGQVFIVQARPETVRSRDQGDEFRSYRVIRKRERLASGHAIGDGLAVGKVCRLDSPAQANRFTDGAVLVTAMTDPDWVPLMRRAAAIVTDHGGRTSHAAIVCRELGLPAVTGTGNGTKCLAQGRKVTVSCAEGDEGYIYAGQAEYETETVKIDDIPATRTQVMLNMGDPASAFRWWRLPADGVGLARLEFVVSNLVKCHPMALAHFDTLTNPKLKRQIKDATVGYPDKRQFFVETLARGVARIAATMYPKPVIVRLTDFKTNEYADLIGGKVFEPLEENPMLGWRGASRYCDPECAQIFGLECAAISFVREVIGLDNVSVMIPFCRTPEEADWVLEIMAGHGLASGCGGLQVHVMCEVPSNAVLLEQFAERFDGFSIGSNDLTQLLLGVDRDSERLAHLFDERNEAVLTVIESVIRRAHACGRKVGLCGQAPSDHPDFARRLVEFGIDSVSVTPDSFLRVKREIARIEAVLSEGVRPQNASAATPKRPSPWPAAAPSSTAAE